MTLRGRAIRALGPAWLFGAMALCGCATGGLIEPPAGPPADPVDASVGVLQIEGLDAAEMSRVVSEMRASALFNSVEETPYAGKLQGVDVYLRIVSNYGRLKILGPDWEAIRADVTALSGSSRKTLHAWRARCGGHDRYCINGRTIARELALALAPGGEAYAGWLADQRGDAPRARPEPPKPAPAAVSDIDRPKAAKPEDRTRFALVIGIGAYKSLPEAKFAARDAETVREHLVAQGYPRRNVILLTGDNATRTGIQKYVEEWLPRNLPEDASLLVYYSGHGAPDLKTGEAYLVPWDGDPQFLQSTAYPLSQLYASLARLRARETIVALDSCFSGAGGRSVLPSGARPLVVKVSLGSVAGAGPLTVLAAASGDEIAGSLDDQAHGLFTYFFLKGLVGEARDASGRVTAQGLLDYLKPRVQDEARRQNREQTPLLLGSPDIELSRP